MDERSGEPLTVDELAQTLGMSDRHLRRLFLQHLGASPLEIMINRRLHLARQLIVETRLPLTEIAFAAGFQSIRRFNESFQELYHRPPTAFRKQPQPEEMPGLRLHLAVRQPYDWPTLLSFLRYHQTYGLECVTDDAYRRFIPQEEAQPPGKVQVTWNGDGLSVEFQNIKLAALRPLMAKLRHLFDVDHNPSDLPQNASQVPHGIRIPGSFDPFETAVSIVLHQFASTEQAQDLLQRLVSIYGHRVSVDGIFTFPPAQVLRNAGLESLGLSGPRAETIRELARLVHQGTLQLSRAADLAATRKILAGIPGMEAWTIEWIAMRCLGDADAFPYRDLMGEWMMMREAELWMSLRSYLSLILWREQVQAASVERGG
jgi:AraC family transcriptional regulator of adaptative response / DNA-3-methyladenine glycosylase II